MIALDQAKLSVPGDWRGGQGGWDLNEMHRRGMGDGVGGWAGRAAARTSDLILSAVGATE